MKRLAVVAAIFLSACATTEFQAYEGKSNVFEGKGGTKIAVDGVDFWDNGEPPRKFKIVGVIDDRRPGAIIPMAQMRGDLARKAKEAGADAVIRITSDSQIAGYYSTGGATATAYGNSAAAYGSSTTVPMRVNTSKFVAIKYLD